MVDFLSSAIIGPVKYHVGKSEVSWMQPRFYNCRTNCLTNNIRGPLVAVKCRQSVTLLECRLKSLYIWVFYTMYCTLILADNVQVTIVSRLCRHCLLRETTSLFRVMFVPPLTLCINMLITMLAMMEWQPPQSTNFRNNADNSPAV